LKATDTDISYRKIPSRPTQFLKEETLQFL